MVPRSTATVSKEITFCMCARHIRLVAIAMAKPPAMATHRTHRFFVFAPGILPSEALVRIGIGWTGSGRLAIRHLVTETSVEPQCARGCDAHHTVALGIPAKTLRWLKSRLGKKGTV